MVGLVVVYVPPVDAVLGVFPSCLRSELDGIFERVQRGSGVGCITLGYLESNIQKFCNLLLIMSHIFLQFCRLLGTYFVFVLNHLYVLF